MEPLLDVLKLTKPEITAEEFLAATDLYGQGLIDSFGIFVLIDEINAAFNINIGAADIQREDLMTVESLRALIQRCGGAA